MASNGAFLMNNDYIKYMGKNYAREITPAA